MSNIIQALVRDKPPGMVLDMGLGSRLQGFPVRDSEPLEAIGVVIGDPAETDNQPRG
jgi:hypothetical protein